MSIYPLGLLKAAPVAIAAQNAAAALTILEVSHPRWGSGQCHGRPAASDTRRKHSPGRTAKAFA
jgi:hypothetical protein